MSLNGMQQLYSNEYISIYSDENNLLLYKIYGYPRFSEVIWKGHDKVYEIVLERKVHRPVFNLVADLRNAKVLLDIDIEFIARISYPRLAKEGVRNLVILLTEDIHVTLNVNKTIEYLGPEVFEHVKLLSNMEEAKNWFREVSIVK